MGTRDNLGCPPRGCFHNWAEGHYSLHFFDWDAVAYDLRARRLICSPDYLDCIRRATLDINLRPTPSPQGNLLRSMRRLMLWRLHPGPALRAFIEEYLDETTFRSLQVKERQLYPNPIISVWNNAGVARQALLEDVQRVALPRQLRLDVSASSVNVLPPILGSHRRTKLPLTTALRLPGL